MQQASLLLLSFSKGKNIEENWRIPSKIPLKGEETDFTLMRKKYLPGIIRIKGIHLTYGTSAREDNTQILGLGDATSRINELLDRGEFATNVELWELGL